MESRVSVREFDIHVSIKWIYESAHPVYTRFVSGVSSFKSVMPGKNLNTEFKAFTIESTTLSCRRCMCEECVRSLHALPYCLRDISFVKRQVRYECLCTRFELSTLCG